MNLRGVVALLLTMAALGCGARDPTSWPRWHIVTPPVSRDFPMGNGSAALSEWTRVANYEFDSSAQCAAAENNVQNALQRPIECVATDDPRFGQ